MTLTLTNLTKQYGNFTALENFNYEFTAGVYGLLGPNGAGKSTLMNIITDNLKPTSGSVRFDGVETSTMDADFRKILGFMPQQQGIYPNFTLERFLYYMAALKGMKKADAKPQIEKLINLVNLQDSRNKRLGGFSGGMKQRALIAQAMLGEPKVIILDEPTAGLDPKERIRIRNLVAQIAFDKIVIIATHVVSDIEFIARDIIMLKKGVIVDNAPPHELTQKIEGKVWNVPCLESDVQSMQDKFRVTNIARDDENGEVLLRVLSDDPPSIHAKNAAPTLEDYYMYIFGDAVSAT